MKARRIFSFFLALLMLFSTLAELIPANAFASEAEEEMEQKETTEHTDEVIASYDVPMSDVSISEDGGFIINIPESPALVQTEPVQTETVNTVPAETDAPETLPSETETIVPVETQETVPAETEETIPAETEETVSPSAEKNLTFKEKIADALRYAFVDMMQDIGRWLVVGLVVAGLITLFVPDSFFALFADNSLLSMVIVLLFAMPMYLCATGSIPIAVALMMKGLSPGTALVLLMAGPAVNAASMLVVGKVLGRRTLILYLISIVGGAMVFGLGVDYLLPREWFTSSIEMMATGAMRGQGWFNITCSVVLALLLVNALVRRFSKGEEVCECEQTACKVSEQTYYIEGLRCNHCRTNAEKAIAALEGVEQAEVDLPTGRAVVRGSVGIDDVRRIVEALGFKLRD